MFNVRAGNHIVLSIHLPGGRPLIEHSDMVKKGQARRLLYAGRRPKRGTWPAGIYTGTIRLERPAGTDYPAPRPVTIRTTVR